jgi:hypothetical protein
MNADPKISEETRIIMFVEYGRLVLEEFKSSDWKSVKNELPTEYGRYETYRKGVKKQTYELWNGFEWAFNNNEITHWRKVKPPYINLP